MRAILSVSDKTGLAELARGLAGLGVELVSTGGTARALAAAGLPVLNVSDVTGFPEMMDGRVKTLHPKIHGGILARRHRPDDLEAIASQGIELVDLVVVNLYPFANAASNPDTPFDELVEQIDIGGPSLLRAAGKNFRDVLVVVDPADYPKVLEQLARPGGPSLEFRFSLMRKAFAHTAEFDSLIAQTMETIGCTGTDFVRQVFAISTYKTMEVADKPLRYGENPHQQAEWGPLPAGYRGLAGSPGEGTVLHQPAGPRRRAPDRARVHRAGGGRHQAHEPVRRRDRGDHRGGLRRRPRGGSPVGLRRHRRPEPRRRRRDRDGDRVHVHRSGDRAGHRRGCAGDPCEEGEHARVDHGLRRGP